MVFTRMVWCCGRRQCSVCVPVTGFAPGRLWWWVQHMGLPSPSLRMWHGVVVAIFVCAAWGHHCHLCTRGMGSPSLSLHMPHRVIAVDAPRVSQLRSLCMSSSWVQHVGSWSRVAAITPHVSWLSPLHCVWCRCCPFCAIWGVAGAFVASGVVLQQLQEGQRWGGQEGHSDGAAWRDTVTGWPGGTQRQSGQERHSDRAARRDTVTWRSQLGRA